jgi:glycosyltransferase involved in cell wall biosynthesis
MNICLVSCGYPPEAGGGIGTYIANLAAGLVNSGHRVFVITRTYGEDKEEIIDGVNVYRCKCRYFPGLERWIPYLAWSVFVAGKINRLDREHGIDIIEFPNWEGAGFWYVAFFPKRPVVMRLHTAYFETFEFDFARRRPTFADRFTFWLEKQSVRKSRFLAATAEYHRELICRTYNIPFNRCVIIPLGVKIDPGIPVKKRANAGRPPTVLTIGRLEYRKGTIDLIESVAAVIDQVPDARFIFIGNDRPHAPGNKTFSVYFGEKHPALRDRVEFIGHVPYEEIDAYYQKADVFALPSLCENFGIVFIEAMKHGLPVVAYRATAVPEVVKNGETGFLVEPNDRKALAEAVTRLLKDPELRNKFGMAGLQRARAQFDHAKLLQKTIGYYEHVMQAGA